MHLVLILFEKGVVKDNLFSANFVKCGGQADVLSILRRGTKPTVWSQLAKAKNQHASLSKVSSSDGGSQSSLVAVHQPPSPRSTILLSAYCASWGTRFPMSLIFCVIHKKAGDDSRQSNSDPCRSPYNRPYFHLRNRAKEGSVVFLNWGREPLLKTLQKTACFTHCLLHRLQILSKMRGARSLAGLSTGSGRVVCRAGHSSHSLPLQGSPWPPLLSPS